MPLTDKRSKRGSRHSLRAEQAFGSHHCRPRSARPGTSDEHPRPPTLSSGDRISTPLLRCSPSWTAVDSPDTVEEDGPAMRDLDELLHGIRAKILVGTLP